MKLAETARTRWVLALASIAFAGTGTAIALDHIKTSDQAYVVPAKTGMKPWRGCHQRKAAPVVAPRRDPDGSDYRNVLLAAKPAFEACTAKQPSGVTYEVRMPIGPDGHVMSVEVRGASSDISKVSMKVVKCLETAVVDLQFPATGERTFVSTNIRTE